MHTPMRMNQPRRMDTSQTSSMFPHTVTVYTVEETTDPNTLEDVSINHITVLRGVLLDASKAANVRESGIEGADAANLYIPFDVVSEAANISSDNDWEEEVNPPDVEDPDNRETKTAVDLDEVIPEPGENEQPEEPKRKKYIGPIEFWRLEDKSDYWTLTDSGNTFFVKGEVVEPNMDRMGIEMAHDDVYSVTKVDVKDFGGLQHFEVGGR